MFRLLVGFVSILVLMAISCTDDVESPLVNNAPTIEQVAAERSDVRPGDRMKLWVIADDADGDSLQFEWTADAGALSIPLDRDTIEWIAPDSVTTVQVSVRVCDGIDLVTESVAVAVTSPEAPEMEWQSMYGEVGPETAAGLA